VNTSWGLESALDTQWAHAIAPGADIILVEAASNSLANLFLAVVVAANLPRVSAVSMSWGTPEFPGQDIFDAFFVPGMTYLVAAGDIGGIAAYPATSPFVIAVGGTTLQLDRRGNRISETAWINGGGGPSTFSVEPAYQMDYPIPFTNNKKGTPDVAMLGDPFTGVSVYFSQVFADQTGWFELAGTSLSAPMWAGLISLANELRRGQNLNSTDLFNSPIYNAARRDYKDNFFDIRSGSAGAFTATRGYDFATGLGSPRADELVKALAGKRRDK
jgi:subtilase family serine protease